jgi:hypothetical protein
VLPFPELLPAGDAKTALWVDVGATSPSSSTHGWTDIREGESWLVWRVENGPVRLRARGYCDFLVSPGNHVRCELDPACDPDSLRHLLLDFVLPLALARAGHLVLHASAVKVGSGCPVFLGASGAGKSTIAAYLYSQGFASLTDDCLLVEERAGRLVAVPSYPGIRLWQDTSLVMSEVPSELKRMAGWTDKHLYCLRESEPFASDPVRIDAAYVLRAAPADDAPSVTPLPAAQAMIEITRHLMHLESRRSQLHADLFDRLANLAAAIPFRTLNLPRDLSKLPASARVVLGDLQTLRG